MNDQNPSLSKSQSVPWSNRDVWLGVGIFGLWLAGTVGLVFAAPQFPAQFDLGLLITVWELVLIVPAWWFAVRKHKTGWKALGLTPFKADTLAIGCGLMLVSFGFNLFYNLFLMLFGLRAQMDLTVLFDQTASPWLLLLGGVVIAPLAEEIFFRGFLFAGLRDRHGWRRAALISAGLFAVLHLQPLTFLPIFLLGLVFAYLYHRSESIWPAVIMHMLTNGMSLGAAYLVARFNLL
jgi:hypothetical protein